MAKKPAKAQSISFKDSCPSCSKIIQIDGTSSKLRERSMLQKCPFCGHRFINENREEPAFYDIFEITKTRALLTSISSAMIFTVYATILVLIMTLIFDLSLMFIAYAAAVLLILAFIFFFSFALHDMPENNKEVRLDYEASEKRLCIPSYAMMLKKYGYRVPERFMKETAPFRNHSLEQLMDLAYRDLNQNG